MPEINSRGLQKAPSLYSISIEDVRCNSRSFSRVRSSILLQLFRQKMAYSRTFSGWRYRNKYGTRSSRRWKSGSRLRALGNAKAARQQRDSATVTINKISQITATIPANESASSVIINHWNMLRLSDYFPNYAPMYDQMKLNKIRVKLTGFRAGTAQTANISPAVILAFDRNGLNPGQTVKRTDRNHRVLLRIQPGVPPAYRTR